MPSPTRVQVIAELLSAVVADPNSNGRCLRWNHDTLCRLTAKPLYAIPDRLLDLLDERIKKLLTAEEFQLERRLTQHCATFRALAIFQGRFVQHVLLSHTPLPEIAGEGPGAMTWAQSRTRAELDLLPKLFEALTEPVLQRREAYLGWLMTYPAFLAERDALRSRWQAEVERLGLLPTSPVRVRLTVHGVLPAEPGSDAERMADDFTAFYERWDLLGLTTWDLPEPKVGNFGAPARFGALAGVEQSPTVQVPPTLRLPDRNPVAGLLRTGLGDHLAEWRAVEEQRHPQKMGYDRLRRVLHLRFLCDLALGGYRDRFHRRVERLDTALADFFGDESAETVRKLRQWIGRRLKAVRARDEHAE